MASLDFYDTLMHVSGDDETIGRFRAAHLAHDAFTFDSIVPMPPALDYALDNIVEDGYDALFGDWRSLAGRWMFKAAAAQRGYPFPLESREQVLACIDALGPPHADDRLRLGRLFKANLDQHGFGHCGAWRLQHWGTEFEADETIAEQLPGQLRVAFSTYGAPPKALYGRLAERWPALVFRFDYLNEWGKRPGALILQGRRKQKAQALPPEACQAAVWGFRREAGPAWFAATLPCPEIVALIEMNERGRPMLQGARMALQFAISRMAAGEGPDELAERFPALQAHHVQALKALAAQRSRARPASARPALH